MALIEYDLFGNERDKVKVAVEIARMFEPKDEPYILAYSGGKDSICAKKILDIAGVRYDTVYNMTSVDPAELVRFIISQFDAVIYDMWDGTHKYFRVDGGKKLVKVSETEMPNRNVIHFTIPKYNMRQLIIREAYPPTRLARYCCEELKESKNQYRVTVTGTRRNESQNRKANSGQVIIFDGKQGRMAAEAHNVNFIQTNRGGGGTQLRRFSFKARSRTVLQDSQDACKSHIRLYGRGCLGLYQTVQSSVLFAV